MVSELRTQLLIGAAGWTASHRFAPRPTTTLRLAVPAALALTGIPDLLLLSTGARVANVVGLMLVHTVVAGSVVVAMSRV